MTLVKMCDKIAVLGKQIKILELHFSFQGLFQSGQWTLYELYKDLLYATFNNACNQIELIIATINVPLCWMFIGRLPDYSTECGRVAGCNQALFPGYPHRRGSQICGTQIHRWYVLAYSC